jgi:hypothetical protein
MIFFMENVDAFSIRKKTLKVYKGTNGKVLSKDWSFSFDKDKNSPLMFSNDFCVYT